jgi:SAM-dependent methyltransferase
MSPSDLDKPYRSAVLDYFARKARDYDRVDEQVYWQLSDELLWELITEVLPGTDVAFRFLDAGGGTGRWTERIVHGYPQSSGVLYDLSAEMLAEARKKQTGRDGEAGRVTLHHGDLAAVREVLAGERFDVVICLHNVAGFVPDFQRCFRDLASLLCPGGVIVLVAPNLYHVSWYNVLRREFGDAAKALNEGCGRFTADMPAMRLFTPTQLRALSEAASLDIVTLTGFPVLTYPGFEETQITGDSPGAAGILSGPSGFASVLDLERSAVREPDVAARGNNLFLAARCR